jgi:hypothetical protein
MGKLQCLKGGGGCASTINCTYLLLHCVCVLNVTCLPFTFVYVSVSSLCIRTGDRISIFSSLCLIACFLYLHKLIWMSEVGSEVDGKDEHNKMCDLGLLWH